MEKIDIKKFIEDEERARENMVWYKRIHTDLIDSIHYNYLGIKEIPSKLRNWIQVIYRGYSEDDVNNLNLYILRNIYKPFKKYVRFQETKGMSLPLEFQSDPGKWLNILKEIEYSLDHLWRLQHEDEYDPCEYFTDEQKEEFPKTIKKGLSLYGEYFMDFWN